MNENREVRALGRVVRLDLVIAVCALLISSFATLASVWQAQLVQKQLSAAVLPYLSITGTFSADEVKFTLENFGPGPAIIRDAVLTKDGVPQKNVEAFLRPMLVGLAPTTHVAVSTTDVQSGDAIRPGDAFMLADVKAKGVRDLIAPFVPHLELTVCYCSILDQCWINSHGAKRPMPVASCNDNDPNMIGPAGFNPQYKTLPKRS